MEKHIGKMERKALEMSPEINLVLSCLRHSCGKNMKSGLRLRSSASMDWERFMTLVEKHRVSALVYRSLKHCRGDKIPPFVIPRLKNRIENATRRTIVKAAELAYIQEGFNQRHIPTLTLKGPVLSLLAFGDLGSRHVGDLDLWVPESHLNSADTFLRQAGYTRNLPDVGLTARQTSFFRRNNSHFGYFRRDKRIQVEIHYRCGYLPSLFPLTFENAWEGRRTIQLGGVGIATFSAEHTLMLLCVHGAVHGWSRLFWLTDVAKLVADDSDISWDTLMNHSNRMGVFRMVAEGLILAACLLDSPLPEAVAKYAQQSKSVSYLVRTAWDRIQSLEDYPNIPMSPNYIRKKRYDFSLRRDLNYKREFLLYQLCPSHDEWEVSILPNYMLSLYFIMKPFSLVNRWRIHYKTK